MNERVALVTGGIRGIGRAIALALAEEGWSVAVCYRTSAREGGETQAEIEERESRGLTVQCDVSDHKAAEDLVGQVEREWGRIDALVNCAGPYHRVNLLEESLDGWHSNVVKRDLLSVLKIMLN